MDHKQIVTRFHLLELGLLVAITLTAWVKIPGDTGLPMHWGLDGHPDAYWSKPEALTSFPVLALLCLGMFAAIGRFAAPESVEPGRPVAEALLTGLMALFCAIQFGLLLIGIGSDIDLIRIIAFGVAVILLLLGVALPTSARNGYAGPRLPWTPSSDRAWAAAHRLTGASLVLGLVGWFFPDPPVLLAATLACVFMPLLLGLLISAVIERALR